MTTPSSPDEELYSCVDSINLHDLNNQLLDNLSSANRLALDIGGSLAKIAYQTTQSYRRSLVCESPTNVTSEVNGQPTNIDGAEAVGDLYQYYENDAQEYRLCFIKFETRYLEKCLDFIKDNLFLQKWSLKDANGTNRIKITGGGAYKYLDMIHEKLGVTIDKEDEMECLIQGCSFLMRNIPDEVFTYHRGSRPAYRFTDSSCMVAPFPFLLVNIGSGVSIMQVDNEQQYKRVGGTSLGGGTFWGIGAYLTGGLSFDELLKLAEKGDHRKVDMLVKDTHGGPNESFGLDEDIIACSLGLVARLIKERHQCKVEDILKSLLITFSNNIGQLAYLFAQRFNLDRVIFAGYFIRGHPITMNTLTYAINFWSREKMKAMFLRHEGYLGAVGAFLKTVEAEEVHGVSSIGLAMHGNFWSENYSCSSGLPSPPNDFPGMALGSTQSASIPPDRSPGHAPINLGDNDLGSDSFTPLFDRLELGLLDHEMEPFPLLDNAAAYVPDTWDITADEEAREYWLNCFEGGAGMHQQKAFESQAAVSDSALQRSKSYITKYINFLHELKVNPCAYGALTVRCLLDAHQNFLREFGFSDPFNAQKKVENEMAFSCLINRLGHLSRLSFADCQLEAVKGMLAGNVFDWGAKEIIGLVSSTDKGTVKFQAAMDKLQARPWLFDDFDKWLCRLNNTRLAPHKCAVIFCDNSGFDIILGVLPFTLQLISRGTKVILATNSGPAINDVTHSELTILIRKLATIVPQLEQSLLTEQLLLCETGSYSPCLDLRCVAKSLTGVVHRVEVDLVVIEGMGRAVHTNLNAKFSCDSLKIAVIKNAWLANRLGGELFSVVFKYETGSPS